MADNWNVSHFIGDDKAPQQGDAGIIVIEEMHYEVKQAATDAAEASDDGGVSSPSPEEVADKYRRMVERVPEMVELLRETHGRICFTTDTLAADFGNRIAVLLREVDGD